jgi:hypothetical protein
MAKKAKKNQQKVISREQALLRKHRATFLMNDKENDAVNVYWKKYKIGKKSKFMREAVMKVVMEQFLDDYPTLFGKQDLDRLISD